MGDIQDGLFLYPYHNDYTSIRVYMSKLTSSNVVQILQVYIVVPEAERDIQRQRQISHIEKCEYYL